MAHLSYTRLQNDALNNIVNAERRGKRQVLIRPSSKVIVKFLSVMQRHGQWQPRLLFSPIEHHIRRDNYSRRTGCTLQSILASCFNVPGYQTVATPTTSTTDNRCMKNLRFRSDSVGAGHTISFPIPHPCLFVCRYSDILLSQVTSVNSKSLTITAPARLSFN